MKIGLDNAPASPVGTYSQHLAKVLEDHAPEHEYLIGGERSHEVDIYHGFRPLAPLNVWMRRVPWVVTLANLNFLRYPGLYSLRERMFMLSAYRRALRSANRVITLSGPDREELAERLKIDPRRIEVVLPLAAKPPHEAPQPEALERVRRKYELPESFALMLGTIEPRHNHEVLLEALQRSGTNAGVVICGRRTAYSDYLLGVARESHIASRVEFLYELSEADLPALFALARAFVYLPDEGLEASIIPIVEALRAGLPMILSDTQRNREAAGDAALYVNPDAVGEVAAALENALGDESFREQVRQRAALRADLFSEHAVAERLMQIYSSL